MPAEAPEPVRERKRGDDEELLRRLMIRYQDGDREAANELVRRVAPMLFGFLSGPGRSRSDTEDLVQQCWLRIHKSRHTYRPSEPLLPWIFAVARHASLDEYRRRKRLDSRELLVEQLPENPQQPETPMAGLKDELGHYLEQLPASQREVILMMKVSGMSLEEVARATSSSVGSVKQKAHRAYEKLRRLLGDKDEYQHRSQV